VGSYKDEQFASGPPNRIASKTPDELLGSWKGEIKTYAGPVPIMMNFHQGGHIGVSIGDQNNWSRLNLIDLTDSRIFGACDGKIPTDDTKRYPHGILLSIKKDGEKLIGEATAVPPYNQIKHSRMYAGLSHYVELTKVK
jgi:hypothetical protein